MGWRRGKKKGRGIRRGRRADAQSRGSGPTGARTYTVILPVLRVHRRMIGPGRPGYVCNAAARVYPPTGMGWAAAAAASLAAAGGEGGSHDNYLHYLL